MKGDYVEGLTDTLDLIILGGYFGNLSYRVGPGGHWTDKVTTFLQASFFNQKVLFSIMNSNELFLCFLELLNNKTNFFFNVICICPIRKCLATLTDYIPWRFSFYWLIEPVDNIGMEVIYTGH